jgi:hypothetical protein
MDSGSKNWDIWDLVVLLMFKKHDTVLILNKAAADYF